MAIGRLEQIAVQDPGGLAAEIRRLLPDTDYRVWHGFLCHVPDGDWEQLLDAGLDTLREFGGEHRGAEIVVESAVEQMTPLALTRMERMIQLCLDGDASNRILDLFGNDELMWAHTAPLRRTLESLSAMPLRRNILYVLAGSHDPEVMQYLRLQVRPEDDFEFDGRWTGMDWWAENPRPLFAKNPLYISLPKEVHLAHQPNFRHPVHPTWGEGREAATLAFGGTTSKACKCGRPLSKLLEFDPVPSEIGVHSVGRLVIPTCLACLDGYGKNGYFDHQPSGEFELIRWDGGTNIENPPPLAVGARLLDLGPRWRKIRKNLDENLNRVGGPPTWIRDSEYPDCLRCSHPMPFLAQVDSDYPVDDPNRPTGWWCNGGILFIHWCDRCRISAQFWQCS